MSLIEKIRRTHREGRLLMKINQRVKPILYGLRYLIKNDPLSSQIHIHCPDYIEPSKDKGELELVERIFKSFSQMKKDQKKAKEYYLPSPMWQKQLDEDYAYLKSSLETNDISKFHFFLTNFGAWEKNLGIGSNILIKKNFSNPIGRRYLKNIVFGRSLKIW